MDNEIYFRDYLVHVQKKMREIQYRYIFWKILAIALCISILEILWVRFCGNLTWQFFGMLLLPLLWAAFYKWKHPISLKAAAYFLDKNFQLAERVTSSLAVLQQPVETKFRRELLADTAFHLGQISFDSQLLAKDLHMIHMKQRALLLAIVGIAAYLTSLASLHIFQTHSVVNDDANIRKSAVFTLADISENLQLVREHDLLSQVTETGQQWQKENRSTAQMLRDLQNIIKKTKGRQRDLQNYSKREFHSTLPNVSSSIPSLSSPEVDLACKIAHLPENARKEMADLLSRDRSMEINALLAQAIYNREERQIAISLQKFQREIADRDEALQKSLLSLDNLAKSIMASSGIHLENGYSDISDHFEYSENIRSGRSASSTRIETQTPLALSFNPQKDMLDKVYLKKPWWPTVYHPMIAEYFCLMERQNSKE